MACRALPCLALLLVACSSAPVAPLAMADAGPGDAAEPHDARRDARDATVDGRSDGHTGDAHSDTADAGGPTTLVFDLAADTTQPSGFYQAPFPSDLRLNAAGCP